MSAVDAADIITDPFIDVPLTKQQCHTYGKVEVLWYLAY